MIEDVAEVKRQHIATLHAPLPAREAGCILAFISRQFPGAYVAPGAAYTSDKIEVFVDDIVPESPLDAHDLLRDGDIPTVDLGSVEPS